VGDLGAEAIARGAVRITLIDHDDEAFVPNHKLWRAVTALDPARGPPNDWGELVQVHVARNVFQASPGELPVIDIHSF